jgi:two-component system, chemotaxis family, chemotaxis protein CheY
MKILMVDDSRTMRNIQKNVLKVLGEPVCIEAGDGLEALTCVAAHPEGFDLMLVDWNMPHMDGLSFVKRLREKDKTTPVIMVTTEAEKSRIIEAIKAGVNNYVIKPFTPDALMERVRQTLAKRQGAAAAA